MGTIITGQRPPKKMYTKKNNIKNKSHRNINNARIVYNTQTIVIKSKKIFGKNPPKNIKKLKQERIQHSRTERSA